MPGFARAASSAPVLIIPLSRERVKLNLTGIKDRLGSRWNLSPRRVAPRGYCFASVPIAIDRDRSIRWDAMKRFLIFVPYLLGRVSALGNYIEFSSTGQLRLDWTCRELGWLTTFAAVKRLQHSQRNDVLKLKRWSCEMNLIWKGEEAVV